MVTFKKIVLTLTLGWFCSCVKDVDYIIPNTNDDTITLSIESYSDQEITETKSTDKNNEWTIHRGYLFFFDDETKEFNGYVNINDDEQVDFSGNNTTSLTIQINHSDYTNENNIICVFNYDSNLDNLINPTLGTYSDSDSYFSGLTSENISDYFPMDADFLAEIEADMNNKTHSIGMPMFVNDFADLNNARREVYRALARIELFIKDGIEIEHETHNHTFNAEDVKFTIVNNVSSGVIGFNSLSEVSYKLTRDSEGNILDVSYNGTDELVFDKTPTAFTTSATDTDNKIYFYEFPYSNTTIEGTDVKNDFATERLSIILEHSDINAHTGLAETLYYKLNIVDKALVSYYDIERNHNYRLVITDVNSRGYTTIEEAYKMPASNIDYEIYDDKGELTISNGQYAISMDEIINYDNVLVYGPHSVTVEFNNICYILPDEMSGIDINDMTNIVDFEIISQTADTETFDVTVLENGFDGTGNDVLTDTGKSIKLELTGSGSVELKLLIKLGNLEVGRESITVSKVGDDGSFDAHPCQIKLNHKAEVSSWNSADADFGLWYNEETAQTVIYMGHNATPTGYRTMDGYITTNAAVNAYPVFSPKSRSGFYTYYNDEGEAVNTKIQLTQLAPFYVGHFGSLSTSSSSVHHYDALIVEKIEEIEDDYSVWGTTQLYGGVMPWSDDNGSTVYYNNIFGYYGSYDTKRYLNLVEGNAITQYMVHNYTQTGSLPLAARYCYMKNDINGNGVIEADEPLEWYLPAQNQMLSIWISRYLIESDDPTYGFSLDGDQYPYYWTCSETDNNTWWGDPSQFTNVIRANMLTGEMIKSGMKGGLSDGYAHVRCVRGISY